MSQPNNVQLADQINVTRLFETNTLAQEWANGYGVIRHSPETCARIVWVVGTGTRLNLMAFTTVPVSTTNCGAGRSTAVRWARGAFTRAATSRFRSRTVPIS